MRAAYHCPVEVSMDVIGGKWTPVVLAHLKEAPRRYAELRRLIPGITEKMLVQRLQHLQHHGLVERTVVSDIPPHVRYSLTPLGRTLEPALQALYDWGERYAERQGLLVTPVETSTRPVRRGTR